MRLLVLNASHEEALAAHSPYYTPSRAARQTETRLIAMARQARLPDTLVLDADTKVDWNVISHIEVWGWDMQVRQRLRRLGAPEHLLPTDDFLETLRHLSSRRTAVALLPLLRSDVPETFGESRFLQSVAEAEKFLQSAKKAVFKAQWSCSGRGLLFATETLTAAQQNRVQRWVARDGGFTAEPFYTHEYNFAFELHYDASGLRLERINTFMTNQRGQYLRNLPNSLSAANPVLQNILHSLQRHLPPLLGCNYAGPLGIDMMWNDGKVHPCVEINLRNTMGRFLEI